MDALKERWAHLIAEPRSTGFAIAFELESPERLGAYLAQRFWRGAVVFGAGTRTVRYRLNASFTEDDVAFLFETIDATLGWLDAHPDEKPPAWQDAASPREGAARESWSERGATIRVAEPSERAALMPAIRALEAKVFEPSRRDSEEHLGHAFETDGVAIVAEVTDPDGGVRLVGFALGAPLGAVDYVVGPDRDVMLELDNTLYSISVVVDDAFRRTGLGFALKRAQLDRAHAMVGADGGPRFRHASGRTRLPEARSMTRLSDRFGAYTVREIEDAYDDGGRARYYRLPIASVRRGAEPRRERGVEHPA